MRSSDRGQASTEYAAVLAVLAVLLALAATAVAAPDLGGAITRHVRVALCIVGGDICRTSDAEAKGLEPCVKREESHDQQDTLTFVLGRSDRKHWSLTQRSDGVWLLTAAMGRGLKASADLVKLRYGDFLDGGIGASASGEWLSGSVWELTERQARGVLDRTNGHAAGLADDYSARYFGMPDPTYRYTEGGVSGALSADVTLGGRDVGTDVDLAGADGDVVLGRRQGAGGDVWYLRATSAIETAIDGLGLPPREGVVEYHVGPPARLVVRGTTGAGGDQTERVVTLPVDRPRTRRLVATALRGGDVGGELRELVRRRALHERRTYRVTADESGLGVTVAGVGVDHRTATVGRELVAAEVLVDGRTVQRIDCLGLERS